MSKGVQIAIGGGLIACLLVWYGASQVSQDAFVYYQTLGEFQAADSGRSARVHGYVALGSIERDVDAQVVRFEVQEVAPHAGGLPDGSLPVVYTSLETPDLFKDGAEVVVEGRMAPDATFHATNVLAKCPSKFEAAQAEGEVGAQL
jgi:cytochrome c-type biogenesis protein CcmE